MPLHFFPEPEKLKLRRAENDELELHIGGQDVPLGSPKRALPLSEPNRFIVFYNRLGQEVGMLRDINELEPDSRVLLQEVLERVYFIRHIARIIEITKEPATGQTRWRVQLESSAGDSAVSTSDYGNEDDKNGAAAGHVEDSSAPKMMSGVLLNTLSIKRDRAGNNGNGKSSSRETAEEIEFCIKGPEDVQTARYPYIFLVDTEGNRYDIPDCDALDLDSRRCAEGFL